MAQTNLEMALEALTLMRNINDGYSLLDTFEIDKIQLMQEGNKRVAEIFAHLNSVYNSPLIEMKSCVEIAEIDINYPPTLYNI